MLNTNRGLDGKIMTYDGENRPVSVSFAGRTTAYLYGADGARLKKVETDPLTGQSEVTLYLGPVGMQEFVFHIVIIEKLSRKACEQTGVCYLAGQRYQAYCKRRPEADQARPEPPPVPGPAGRSMRRPGHGQAYSIVREGWLGR